MKVLQHFRSTIFKVCYYVDGTDEPFFFVYNRDTPLEVFRIELETDVAINLRLR
jgi:hypothetical protein